MINKANVKSLDTVFNFNLDSNSSVNESYLNADGDDNTGEANTTEPTADDESGVDAEDLPKYRQLVREKKIALKVQYGQGRYVVTSSFGNHKVGDSVSFATAQLHMNKTKWTRGFRYYWKQFKNSGGKSTLKQQAKSLTPTTPTTPTTTTSVGTDTTKKGTDTTKTGVNSKDLQANAGNVLGGMSTTMKIGIVAGGLILIAIVSYFAFRSPKTVAIK